MTLIFDNSTINSGQWTNLFEPVNPTELPYNYNTTYDFSLIPTIVVTDTVLVSTDFVTISMQLIDNLNQTGTITQTPIKGVDLVFTPLVLSGQVDLTNIAILRFVIVSTIGMFGTSQLSFSSLTSTTVCLSSSTQILMQNQSYKTIEDLKRGDTAADYNLVDYHKIARVLKIIIDPVYMPDAVKIIKNALGENLPFDNTILTAWHPILWNGIRSTAKSFKNIKDCEWQNQTTKTSSLMAKDKNGTYSFYNLQFDHEGLFIANGLTVQAVSSWSNIFPLAKKDFYHYVEKPFVSESYITDTVWSNKVLEKL